MRLIDADNTNLREAIERNAFRNRQDIIDLINNQATVDAVPVVRCKDCKYHHDEGGLYLLLFSTSYEMPR